MIHFATVHHQNPYWVRVQKDYLDRYVTEPYRLVACYDSIPAALRRVADVVLPAPPGCLEHSDRLRVLYEWILADGCSPNDLIVFIDSDSLPISKDFANALRRQLRKSTLVAVRRDENLGDLQPHPCLCAATIAQWRELSELAEGENLWARGATGASTLFGNADGDPGGFLLGLLTERDLNWTPLLRSNEAEIHEVLFGIYGSIVYHHGGGSRVLLTRADLLKHGSREAALRSSDYVRVKAADNWLRRQIPSNHRFHETLSKSNHPGLPAGLAIEIHHDSHSEEEPLLRGKNPDARHHVIISGTGRAGTTLLVQLLTHLGMNTGLDPRTMRQRVRASCNAGLEFDVRRPGAPYVCKAPRMCLYVDEVVRDPNLVIDHALIPIRSSLFAAAESRRVVQRRAEAEPGDVPDIVHGGLTWTADPDDQENALLRGLYDFLSTLAGTHTPVTLLRYPQFAKDPEYLYEKLRPLIPGISLDRFQRSFDAVVEPELINSYDSDDT